MRVLMITSEWPSKEQPWAASFIVDQVNSLRAKGVDIETFSFRGRKNPFQYLKAWLEVRSRYKNKTFDLVHAQFGQSGLVAMPSKIPMIVTFHGSDLQGIVNKRGNYTLQGKLLRLISRYVAKRASRIIVVSQRLIKFLPKHLSADVVPCGIDVNLFRPLPKNEARKQLGLNLESRLILFAAHPDNPVKRYFLAQKSVELLNEKMKAKLIVASNIKHEEMPLYMNACDVLLMTSLHEGSPMVIKEALACNLPIVSVDVGDVRQQIQNVKGCQILENEKPEKIAEVLKETLTSPKRVAGEITANQLSLEKTSEKILEIYKAEVEKV